MSRGPGWEATADVHGNSVTGKAETKFTFGEFEMEVPELFFLISIDDNIRWSWILLRVVGIKNCGDRKGDSRGNQEHSQERVSSIDALVC